MKRFIAVGCLLLLLLPILAISVSANNSVPLLYLICDYKYTSSGSWTTNKEIPISDIFVNSRFYEVKIKGIKWYRSNLDCTNLRYSFNIYFLHKLNTSISNVSLPSQGYSFDGDYAYCLYKNSTGYYEAPINNAPSIFDLNDSMLAHNFSGVICTDQDTCSVLYNTPLDVRGSDTSGCFAFAITSISFSNSFQEDWLNEIYDFRSGTFSKLDTIIGHQANIDTNVNTLRLRFNAAIYTPLINNTFYGRVVSYDSDGRFSYTQTQSDFFQAVVRNQLAIFDIFARNQEKQNEAIDIGLGDLISDGYDTLGSSGVGDLADIFGIFGSAGWDDDAFYNSSSSGLLGWFSQSTMSNIDTVNTPVKGASTHDIITGGNSNIIDFYSNNLDWFNELMGDD